MAVSNVNNTNIVKLALAKKTGGKKVEAFKPDYMKMTGSIFNAPEVKGDGNRENVAMLNTKASLKNLAPKASGKSSNLNPDELANVDSVSGGKAAVASGRSTLTKVKGFTEDTQNDEKTVKNLARESEKLGASITKNDKVFAARLKREQQEFDKDNDKLTKLAKETEETQKEIDNAQHELEQLSATNSFQIGNSNNQGRIKELQNLIGSKVVLLQNNGKAIYSLQRSQTRTIGRMNRTNRQYVNTQKTNQKNIQQQENSNNKIIDVANKIEQFSAMAQAGGQALHLAGEALMALGGLMSCGFGAALVAIGQVMSKVGAVVELAGNYGQTAANITKTAAYAADGNIMGAMQSAAMAMQTGAAAVKGTKNLKNTFGQINEQANEATQKIAAKSAAKDIVNDTIKNADNTVDKKALAEKLGKNVDDLTSKEIQNEALGGLSKKQARKYVTADLRAQMASGEIKLEGKWANTQLKNFNEQLRANLQSDDKTKENVFTGSLDRAKADYENNKFKAKISEFNKKVISNRKYEGTNFGSMIEKLGGNVTNIAMVFAKNKAMDEMTNNMRRPLPQYQMDARTRSIMERNQRYRMHAMY